MMKKFQKQELQRVKELNSYDNNICPDWVVEITKILMKYHLYSHFNHATKIISVLNVPEEFREEIFLETKKRNLWFEIKKQGKMVYKGLFRLKKEPAGIINIKTEFFIYENNTDEEIVDIFYCSKILE